MESTRQDVDDLRDLRAELGIRHRQATTIFNESPFNSYATLTGVELVGVSSGRIVISLRLLAVSDLNEYFISFPVSSLKVSLFPLKTY